jgi:hypothetical protein
LETCYVILHKLSSISEGNTADKKGDKFYPKRSYDYEFKLYGVNIGIGNSYSYFCLLFNYNDNFTIAGKKLFEQAQNAVYGKLRNISIPTNL